MKVNKFYKSQFAEINLKFDNLYRNFGELIKEGKAFIGEDFELQTTDSLAYASSWIRPFFEHY